MSSSVTQVNPAWDLRTPGRQFVHDADRLARFTREAGGTPALVMELVEGETLADLIGRSVLARGGTGGLPIDEVVALAREMARGLEAAHEKGIVHRDLKPANVKVTPDGRVKILDFGLAKALTPEPAASDAMNSPTLTARSTEAGMILGTAAYMSPEQARGKPVDKRADIWAFGAVVYEMLTGERAFGGETVSDTLASVLKTEPDWSRLPPDTPPALRRLLARCLERDPSTRLRDIGEARVALDAPDRPEPATATPPAATAAGGLTPSARRPLPWMASTVVLAVVAAAGWLYRPSPAPVEFELALAAPDGAEYRIGPNLGGPVVSPDGSTVAFVAAATGAGNPSLWVRSLARNDARPLPRTEGAYSPFWSPDGTRLGFFADGQLRTIAVANGLPERVADAPAGRGGTWGDDDTIVFTPIGGGAIVRVPASGGDLTVVTTLDQTRGENAHYWPVMLPGTRRIVYFVRSTVPSNNGIYATNVDGSGTPIRLVSSLSSAVYAPAAGGGPGHLLWVRDGDLLAQQFDTGAAELVGPVSTVAPNVRVEESQRGVFASVSSTGVLVWADARAANAEFVLFDRNGKRLERLAVDEGALNSPAWSPDGSKILFTRAATGSADVWLHDLAAGTTQQVTSDPDYDELAVWSPDGRQMMHLGDVDGRRSLMLTTFDGSSAPRAMAEAYARGLWTPDGRLFIYSALSAETGLDLWALWLANPEARVALNVGPGNDVPVAISPDGRWLAVGSVRDGEPETVLTRLIVDGDRPRLGTQRIPISRGLYTNVYWHANGREFVTSSPDGQVLSTRMAAEGNAVRLETPVPLFTLPTIAGTDGNWAANADLMQFVAADAPRAVRQMVTVLSDWTSRLQR